MVSGRSEISLLKRDPAFGCKEEKGKTLSSKTTSLET